MKPLMIVNLPLYKSVKNAFARRCVEKVKKELNADIVFTKYRGHAGKIARDSAGYATIVAGGGDGTVAEVVNGMDLEAQKLAIMPLGTGNGLARDLGINTIRRSGDIIQKGRTDKIDVLHCRFKRNGQESDRYIISTSGIGFTAAVADFGNRYLKITGPICYSFATCFRLFGQKVISAEIKIDSNDCRDISFTNFLVNNTKHAGNACIFPEARLDDSYFDILCRRENALGQYLWDISVITRAYFYRVPEQRIRSLYIKLKRPSLFMADGEIFDSVSEMTFSIIGKRLMVMK